MVNVFFSAMWIPLRKLTLSHVPLASSSTLANRTGPTLFDTGRTPRKFDSLSFSTCLFSTDSPSQLTLETAIPSVGIFESSPVTCSSALELLVKSRFPRALCLLNVPNELILPVTRRIFVERRSINQRERKKRIVDGEEEEEEEDAMTTSACVPLSVRCLR